MGVVLSVEVSLPATAAQIQDAITIVAGQNGDPSTEVKVEKVEVYDSSVLSNVTKALRVSRDITDAVESSLGEDDILQRV